MKPSSSTLLPEQPVKFCLINQWNPDWTSSEMLTELNQWSKDLFSSTETFLWNIFSIDPKFNQIVVKMFWKIDDSFVWTEQVSYYSVIFWSIWNGRTDLKRAYPILSIEPGIWPPAWKVTHWTSVDGETQELKVYRQYLKSKKQAKIRVRRELKILIGFSFNKCDWSNWERLQRVTQDKDWTPRIHDG